jgi:hypothetical protein
MHEDGRTCSSTFYGIAMQAPILEGKRTGISYTSRVFYGEPRSQGAHNDPCPLQLTGHLAVSPMQKATLELIGFRDTGSAAVLMIRNVVVLHELSNGCFP